AIYTVVPSNDRYGYVDVNPANVHLLRNHGASRRSICDWRESEDDRQTNGIIDRHGRIDPQMADDVAYPATLRACLDKVHCQLGGCSVRKVCALRYAHSADGLSRPKA